MRGTQRTVAVAAVVAVVVAVLAVVLGVPWLWAGAATAAAVGTVVGVPVVRARRAGATRARSAARSSATAPSTDPSAAQAPRSVREVDDLRDFFDRPPGSPTALPAGAVPDAPAAVPATPGPGADVPAGRGRRGARRGAVVALTLLVLGGLVAGGVVLTGDRGPGGASSRAPAPAPAPAEPSRTGTAPSAAPTPQPAPLTATAAGGLAGTDVPPGVDGFTASLTFAGIVLEPRAVGVTVAYPVLTASSDGSRAVAHLELPVWNCLAADPPADPAAAQCTRSLTEYADLGSPDLVVDRSADGAALRGTFATYTRPNGSAPVYTGRSYAVEVEVGSSPTGATGTLRLGGGEAAVLPGGTVRG
ncbi:hypothetical protein SAMN03159343_2647 [Klenkia marina]|uniref:Uncharacterized protein n=1 Tax=Klenkia marina TaxID=1960309 RepID=A0A1G4YED5_9ACTN|nr:hypothetical protein [Klenkia marina]SCX51866.1 hypothetical protein SAMN03159343_2647 [Klenkia marina]